MVFVLLLAASLAPGMEEATEAGPQRPILIAQRTKPPRDDFDLLPKEAPLSAAALARQRELERQLAKRRTMLTYHQIGGRASRGAAPRPRRRALPRVHERLDALRVLRD